MGNVLSNFWHSLVGGLGGATQNAANSFISNATQQQGNTPVQPKPMGINTVTVTLSSAAYVTSTQYTWTGVDQALPFTLTSNFNGNTNSSTGSGTTLTVNKFYIVPNVGGSPF